MANPTPVLALGLNDYVAKLPPAFSGTDRALPIAFTFENANTSKVTLDLGEGKKPVQKVVGGTAMELPAGALVPKQVYLLTETDAGFVLDAPATGTKDNPRRFQVRYKDGGGEQITGESADAVRAAQLAFWGDREIASVEELK